MHSSISFSTPKFPLSLFLLALRAFPHLPLVSWHQPLFCVFSIAIFERRQITAIIQYLVAVGVDVLEYLKGITTKVIIPVFIIPLAGTDRYRMSSFRGYDRQCHEQQVRIYCLWQFLERLLLLLPGFQCALLLFDFQLLLLAILPDNEA